MATPRGNIGRQQPTPNSAGEAGNTTPRNGNHPTRNPGGHCAHCGTYRDVLGGWAQGVKLCHPNDGMDCYRLVTVYKEPVGARLPGGELYDTEDPISTLDRDLERWAELLRRLA